MADFYGHSIEDASLTLDESGGSLTLAHILDGLPEDADALLWTAVNDPRIPRYGQPHPVVPGIRVTNITATQLDKNKARVAVTYSRPQPDQDTPYEPDTGSAADPEGRGTFSMSATITDEDTQRALDGTPLLVEYTGTLVDEDGNDVEVASDPQVATVTVGRPMAVLTFTRREIASPINYAFLLVGAINSTQLGEFPPLTLLCTRIDSNTDDDGQSFNVSYEFQYNRSRWLALVSYIDKETGAPPADIVEATLNDSQSGPPSGSRLASANGTALYQLHPLIDFNWLNLPWYTGGARR